jgi:hypothetical protein
VYVLVAALAEEITNPQLAATIQIIVFNAKPPSYVMFFHFHLPLTNIGSDIQNPSDRDIPLRSRNRFASHY